jgi:hypothetical protein
MYLVVVCRCADATIERLWWRLFIPWAILTSVMLVTAFVVSWKKGEGYFGPVPTVKSGGGRERKRRKHQAR